MKSVFVLCLCAILYETGYSNRVVIHTSDQWGRLYNFFPLRTNVLRFSVKANNDVHVLLANGPQFSPPYYEVVIGGWENSKSAIRKDNDDHQVEYSAKIIKPGVFQTFTVTIDDKEGAIEVGKKVDEPFMRFKDPDYVKMSYFGISTGFRSNGEWNFEFETFYCSCNSCNHSTSSNEPLKEVP